MLLCQKITNELSNERQYQVDMWGIQHHTDAYWLAILMEEIGESSKGIVEGRSDELVYHELVQSAAVIIAWLEDINFRKEVSNAHSSRCVTSTA